MSAIVRALGSGYTAQQILKFLTQNFPALAGPIKKATAAGYSINEILKFLNMQTGGSAGDNLTEAQIHQRRDIAQNEAVKSLLKSGAAALAGYGAARAVPAAMQQLGRVAAPAASAIPQAAPSPQLPIGPTPMANAPVAPPQIPPIPQGGAAQAAQATPAPVVPQTGTTPQTVPQPTVFPQNSLAIIREMGLEGKIKNLQKAGNPPEAIVAGIEAGLSPGQKKWLGEKIKAGEAKDVASLVKDYLTSEPTVSKTETVEKEKSIPFAGGRIVATPSGIVGSVESEKTKQALVNEDGKLKKLERDEMFDVPEQLQNLDYRDMARKYVESFPKEGQGSLSSNVASLLYDYDSGEMYGSYLGSPDTLYAWKNVPAQLYEKIKSQTTAPKTSGEAFTGQWDASVADSLGSPLQEITSNPELYPFRKLSVGYNIMAKLLDAIKEEHKEHEKRKREKKAPARNR